MAFVARTRYTVSVSSLEMIVIFGSVVFIHKVRAVQAVPWSSALTGILVTIVTRTCHRQTVDTVEDDIKIH